MYSVSDFFLLLLISLRLSLSQVTWVPEGHLTTTVSAEAMFKDVSVGMAMQGAGDAPMTQRGADFNMKTTNETTGGSWGETSYLVTLPLAPSGETTSLDWEGGEGLDPNDPTLRNGKKFYSRSFRGGGGRGGHEEGGARGNRWRGERRGVGGYRGVGRRDNRDGFRERDRGDRRQEGRGDYQGNVTSKGQNVRGRGRGYHHNQQQSNGREAGYSSGLRNPPYTDL